MSNVEDTRSRLVAAVLASFKFDTDKIEAMEEDDQVQATQKLAIFAIATADTCLQIMMDNPFEHMEPPRQ